MWRMNLDCSDNSLTDHAWFSLPCSKTNRWDLSSRIQIKIQSFRFVFAHLLCTEHAIRTKRKHKISLFDQKILHIRLGKNDRDARFGVFTSVIYVEKSFYEYDAQDICVRQILTAKN